MSREGFPAARCEGFASVRVTPLGAGEDGVVFAVGGRVMKLARREETLGASIAPIPAGLDRLLGSPRSPDGATAVLQTPRGLLVLTGASGVLLAGSDLDRASWCAPSNGGKRLACAVGETAVIYEAP